MLFRKKRNIFVLISVFFGIAVFAMCFTSGNSNYSIYKKYIKAETIHFNFKDRTLPLFIDDSTCSLADMEAYETQGNLEEQNQDSLYYGIRKAFPSIQIETINDFYSKNKNKTLVNSDKLSLLIKMRKILTIFNSHNYPVLPHELFSPAPARILSCGGINSLAATDCLKIMSYICGLLL